MESTMTDKKKFDAVLTRLLKTKPLKRSEVKTTGKSQGKVIRPQGK